MACACQGSRRRQCWRRRLPRARAAGNADTRGNANRTWRARSAVAEQAPKSPPDCAGGLRDLAPRVARCAPGQSSEGLFLARRWSLRHVIGAPQACRAMRSATEGLSIRHPGGDWSFPAFGEACRKSPFDGLLVVSVSWSDLLFCSRLPDGAYFAFRPVKLQQQLEDVDENVR